MLISAFNWYGLLIGGGMAVCILLALLMAKKRGYDLDNIYMIAIVCIPLAILGARTYYVVNDIIHNGNSWSFPEFFGFSKDGSEFKGLSGLAIYGGLIGGIIGAVIVRALNKRKPPEKQMTFIQMADLAFCLIILGQAIGRWGNYANQEAYGQLVTNPALQWFPFAVYIDKMRDWYNACFFYESMWNLIGFGLLQWLYNGKRKSFDGFCFAFYCMWYGFIRFIVEHLRSDSMWFGPIKANQLISALVFALGAGIIIYHLVMSRKKGKKPFIFVDESELSSEYYGYETSFICLRKKFAAQKAEKENSASDNAEEAGGETASFTAPESDIGQDSSFTREEGDDSRKSDNTISGTDGDEETR